MEVLRAAEDDPEYVSLDKDDFIPLILQRPRTARSDIQFLFRSVIFSARGTSVG